MLYMYDYHFFYTYIVIELRKSMNGIYGNHSECIFNRLIIITDYKNLVKD